MIWLSPQPAMVTTIVPTSDQTVSANLEQRNETLYINPAGTLASLTIALPPVAGARVGQIIRVFVSKIITNSTVSSAGGTIAGTILDTTAPNIGAAYQFMGGTTWVILYPQ